AEIADAERKMQEAGGRSKVIPRDGVLAIAFQADVAKLVRQQVAEEFRSRIEGEARGRLEGLRRQMLERQAQLEPAVRAALEKDPTCRWSAAVWNEALGLVFGDGNRTAAPTDPTADVTDD